MAVLSDVALIVIYMCVLVIKTCDASSLKKASPEIREALCSSYGVGSNANGEIRSQHPMTNIDADSHHLHRTCPVDLFLFFIILGIALVFLGLVVQVATAIYCMSQNKKLRRLRYRRGDEFVELALLSDKDFAHLPGLEPSACFHLFLSRTPRGMARTNV